MVGISSFRFWTGCRLGLYQTVWHANDTRLTIKFKEDFREVGIEDYVETVNLLYNGGNKGKLAIKLSD